MFHPQWSPLDMKCCRLWHVLPRFPVNTFLWSPQLLRPLMKDAERNMQMHSWKPWKRQLELHQRTTQLISHWVGQQGTLWMDCLHLKFMLPFYVKMMCAMFVSLLVQHNRAPAQLILKQDLSWDAKNPFELHRHALYVATVRLSVVENGSAPLLLL